MKQRYYQKKRRPAPRRDRRVTNIRPRMDNSLRPVFSRIGVPAPVPFQADPFQEKALAAIPECDCLVTAPTGSGKTWIAENAIRKIYRNQGKAWYASPLKALSNSIYAQFKEQFGPEQVGILTGDRKENPTAPIIVGTTEILRNHLYDAMHQGTDLSTDLVILDEAHFLGDTERGVVWEEIMIYLPIRIPLLMLSATVGNAGQVAEWLYHIRQRECVVIQETQRPVPLYPLFFHPYGRLTPLVTQTESPKKQRIHKQIIAYINQKNKPLLSAPGKLPPVGDILRVLRKYHLLPAIFFMKSRIDCDQALNLCDEKSLSKDPDRGDQRSRRILSLVQGNPHIQRHRQLRQLEHMAVAAHHSGQLPAWKVVVETLMAEGLLDAIFATSTVAAGVDFPARTVVILHSDRFNGVSFQPLTATEFHQMTGRSGRRGKDNIGFALVLPGKFMDIRLISKLIRSRPLPIDSQIRINFSMVLNLLLSHTPSQIQELLDRSFATFQLACRQDLKQAKPLEPDTNPLWHSFQHHLDFLQTNHYVDTSNQLTPDGIWASKLRIDHPLVIAEAFRQGILPKSDPVLLAALTAAFVNERENADDHIRMDDVPKQLAKQFLRTKKTMRPFNQVLRRSGFPYKPLYLKPAETLYQWARGGSWTHVVKSSGLAEGDLARLILRTADNLRHFRNLLDVFPKIAKTSQQSIDLILRDPLLT